MNKIDKTVLKETVYIAAWVAIFSVLMQAVYLILHRWDYTVLLGNLLGMAAATGNFLLLGITVQRAVDKEQKEAANLIRLSQSGRHMLIILVALVAVVLPCFDLIATMIPLFFPGIAVRFRPLFDKKMDHT